MKLTVYECDGETVVAISEPRNERLIQILSSSGGALVREIVELKTKDTTERVLSGLAALCVLPGFNDDFSEILSQVFEAGRRYEREHGQETAKPDGVVIQNFHDV